MSPRVRLVLAFSVVYLVWGSTYFAMRLVVADVPPLTAMGARFVLAGLILGGIGWLRGEALPTARHLRSAAVVGVLLFVCGNGGVSWAQSQGVPSGTASLLVATVPMWMTLIGRMLGERTPAIAWGGLVVGFAGTALLVRPGASASWPALVVVLGAAGWALGSLLARRLSPGQGGSMTAASQVLLGGAALFTLGAARGELASWPAEIPTVAAGAWLYLVVFGSVVGFRAYGWLLQHVAPAKVGTYAYVNPVVAVMIGALAGESITIETGWAMALVLTGVAGIVATRAPGVARPVATVAPCPAVVPSRP